MKTMRLLMAFMMISMAILSSSCSKDDNDDPNYNPEHLHGAFITCEGGFNKNNASISYLDNNGVLKNELYKSVNGVYMGDIAQSFTVQGDRGYIVVNNSQKVVVVDMKTFEKVAEISEGIDYPRHFLGLDNSVGYITNGSAAGTVLVVDLEKNEIIKTITVGDGPEDIVKSGDYVFVANSGGYGSDNSVSVINPQDHTVVKTIQVGDIPVNLDVDANGDVWVLCKGLPAWAGTPTNSKLVKINRSSLTAEKSYDMGGSIVSNGTKLLAMGQNKEYVYYQYNGIFKMSIDASDLPDNALIAKGEKNFYGIAVDPSTGDIYGFEEDFSGAPGVMHKYKNSGVKVKTMQVGVGPTEILFY